MCYFLAVVAEHLPVSSRSSGFHLVPIELLRRGALRYSEHAWIATTAPCDCASPLLRPRPAWALSPAIQKKMRAFAKRGWHQSKIDRWVEEQKRIAETPGASHPASNGEHPSVKEWSALLRDLIDLTGTSIALAVLNDGPGGEHGFVCNAQERASCCLDDFVKALPLVSSTILDVSR